MGFVTWLEQISFLQARIFPLNFSLFLKKQCLRCGNSLQVSSVLRTCLQLSSSRFGYILLPASRRKDSRSSPFLTIAPLSFPPLGLSPACTLLPLKTHIYIHTRCFLNLFVCWDVGLVCRSLLTLLLLFIILFTELTRIFLKGFVQYADWTG